MSKMPRKVKLILAVTVFIISCILIAVLFGIFTARTWVGEPDISDINASDMLFTPDGGEPEPYIPDDNPPRSDGVYTFFNTLSAGEPGDYSIISVVVGLGDV